MNVLFAMKFFGICMLYRVNHKNYVRLSNFVVHYGFNKSKKTFAVQHKIVIITLLSYF